MHNKKGMPECTNGRKSLLAGEDPFSPGPGGGCRVRRGDVQALRPVQNRVSGSYLGKEGAVPFSISHAIYIIL